MYFLAFSKKRNASQIKELMRIPLRRERGIDRKDDDDLTEDC
jgi:hypothetical protein